MVSGITPCAQECKWIDYFGEPPYRRPQLQGLGLLMASHLEGMPKTLLCLHPL